SGLAARSMVMPFDLSCQFGRDETHRKLTYPATMPTVPTVAQALQWQLVTRAGGADSGPTVGDSGAKRPADVAAGAQSERPVFDVGRTGCSAVRSIIKGT